MTRENRSFGHTHYVPILKAKEAEFSALRTHRSRDGLTPFIEVVPSARIELSERLTKTVAKLRDSWGTARPFFVDLLFVPSDGLQTAGGYLHPIAFFFAKCREVGLQAVPVTGTGRRPHYQRAVRDIVSEDQRGLCVRLVPEDFTDREDLTNGLDAVRRLTRLDESEVDLVIDHGSVTSLAAASVSAVNRADLRMLPKLEAWRTITVVSGAFPLSLGPLDIAKWNVVPRNDWLAWHQTIVQPDELPRLPAYGDYTVAHPDLPPEGIATILGQLRYSTDRGFLIWKGTNAIKRGFAQFYDICAALVGRSEYFGFTFSEGDRIIQQKAARFGSPGNALTWRMIGVSHHLALVAEQIASLRAT